MISCIKSVTSKTICYWMNLVEVYQFRAKILLGTWEIGITK